MKKICWVLLMALGVSAAAVAADPMHVMLAGDSIKWGDAPPVLPKGVKLAVLSGDPGKEGTFVVRLKFPAGTRVAPHWHPTDEHVTVLEGTAAMGMGETFDEAKMTTLTAGSYALMPATMRHYAMAKTDATIQVSGQGPFVLNYVNASDDPSKK